MQIIPVRIRELLSPAFLAFVKKFLEIIAKYDANKLKITNQIADINSTIKDLENGLAKEESNDLVKTLNTLDQKRDSLIRGFIKWLKSMTHFDDATTVANAQSMLKFIDGLGKDIADMDNLSETGILTSIVKGFTDDATRKANLAAMGGTNWITAIDKVNNDYIAASAKRTETDTADAKIPPFFKTRKTTTTFISKAEEMLQSRYRTALDDKQPVDIYEKCFAELNEMFKLTNQSVELSGTHKPAKSAEEEPPIK